MVPKLTSSKRLSLLIGLLACLILICFRFIPTVSSRAAKLDQDLEQYFIEYEPLQLDVRAVLKQVRDTGRLSIATSELSFDLVLVPHDMRAPGYRAEEIGADGAARVIDIGPVRTFKGRARGGQAGTKLPQQGEARFTIDEKGIEGLIITPTEHYFVEPSRKYSDAAVASDYVIYRKSDVVTSGTRDCAVTLSEQVTERVEALRSKNAPAINQVLPQVTGESSLNPTLDHNAGLPVPRVASESSLLNLGVIDATLNLQPLKGFYRTSAQIIPSDTPGVQSLSVNELTAAAQGCDAEPIRNGQQLQRTLKSGCAFAGGQLTDIYSFSGKSGQDIIITMTSTAFDTQLYLYYGPVNALTILAQDDNGGGGTNSRLPPGSGTFRLPATNTYYIYATSVLPNQTGKYSITFSLTTPVSTNDNFANAQLLPGSNGSVSGITLSASKETGEPNHADNAGGASIWYRWQAPATGHQKFVTTLSDFDTLLAVYTGDTLTSLVPVASNNDADGTLQSNVTFATNAGTVYYIAVDGVNGATGQVLLSFGPSRALEDANDAFANATQISGPLGTAFGDNLFATKEPEEPNHAGNAGGASIWYRWEAPVTGRFAFSTAGSDFDTLLGAYTGGTVSALTLIAGNDDDPAGGSHSRVEFNAISGTVYYLALDGFNSAKGNSTLVWAPGNSVPTPTPTPTPSPTPTPIPTTPLLQELRIATEADNEYVASTGGPAASSQAILSTLNQVEGLFEVELGLTFRVVYQSAWNTSNDPFSSTNPTELLGELSNHWNANRGSVARDVVHMWTGKQLDNSTIGTAYLEALCRFAGNGRAAYGLSKGVLNQTQQVAITAHEIGHNLGATHPNQQVPPVAECDNTVMNRSVTTEPQLTFCQFSRDEIATYLRSSAGCLGAGTSGLKFALRSPFFLGESPKVMVSVDFNGDGKEDLATANESGNISVLLGSDDGSLHEATGSPFLAGSVPTSMVTVDLNRDGAHDIAVTDSNGKVGVFLGTGNGSFLKGPGSPLSAGLSPGSIAAADFNGDGLQDLAVANGSGDDVSVFQGTGDGVFLAPKSFAVTPDPNSITTGDFNRDGKQDFAVTSGRQSFTTVLLSAGDAGFQQRVSYPVGSAPAHSVAARDFTGDGILDLLVLQGGNSSEINILNGIGDGTFQPSTIPPVFFTPSSQPESLVTADFDGDGKLDFAISFLDTDLIGRVSAHVIVGLGRGDGSFASLLTIVVDSPSSVTAGDLNGDGNVDLITTMVSGVNVLLGNGTGIFQDVGNFSIGKNPNGSMAVGDFNGDGVRDIAVIDRNEELDARVAVVPGSGSGVSYIRGLFNAQLITAGDFNGDGALDVAVTVPNLPFDDIRLLMGNNTGHLGLAGAYTAGGFTTDVTAADFNNDGRDDVVVTTQDSINILFGTSTGGLQTPVTVSTDQLPTIEIGDFNGDSKIDLVTRGKLLLGNGDGSFHVVSNADIDAGATAGDFNSDGYLDLIMAGKFLKGNGDGTFQVFDDPRFGGSGLAADFNGDGKLDLANSGVSVRLGNGDGSFQAPLQFPLPFITNGLVAGDFNGDNKIDLATTTKFTNQFGGTGIVSIISNTTGSALSAPLNDHFVLARTIGGSTGTLAGTTILATVEAGEPNHASASNGTGGVSIWYRWTAPFTGKFYFQTFSSSFSNVIAVYTGTDLMSLTPVVKSTVNVPEYVEINATAGTTYQIAIDGVTGDSGRTVLTWNTGSLSNDNFAFAREIRGSSGAVNGDNTNFTLETNEPLLPGAATTGFSAWYRWTAPNTGKVSFATTPCGDTTRLLGAYTGNFLNLLTPVAVNFDGYRDFDNPGGCDQRTLRFNAVAGTTYRIQLRSVSGAPFKLEWNYANPPANDNFANALVLASNSGSVLGTNRDATKEAGEPNHAGGPGGASIWYRWTAPTSGQVTFDTLGFRNQTNSFRYLTALMAVYTGASFNSLTSVVTNATDNKVTFNATMGTTYHIAIDSGPYEGGGYLPGIVPLHWGAKQVANDDFNNAQPLTIASSFTPVLGSNTAATKEPGEPNHAGSAGGTSVWYRWTALSSDNVSFDLRACISCTLSTSSALVGIYTGASVNALMAVPATADNLHTFAAVRGTTYFIAVDSIAAGGTYEFSLVSSNISARNDNFSRAQVLSGSNGVVAGDNSGATEEPGEPDHANDRGGASVWYQWKAPASGLYTFDTFGSNFDTLIAVYTGEQVNALSVVASSDNANSSAQSRVTFDAKLNTTYFIAVDGKSTGVDLGSGLPRSEAGFILLNWNNLPAPVNDNFANAQALTAAAGNVSGRNTVASKEGGEPNHAGGPGGASVWYQWTAPSSGNFSFNTFGSDFNTLLGVYTGATVNALTAISSNDDVGGVTQSRVTFNAVAGTVYYIAVDGSPSVPGNVTPFSGNIVLSWFPEKGVTHDNFLSAQPLNGSAGSLAATNAQTNKEPGEPLHAGDRGGSSVWYTWTAPFTGPVLFTTAGSDFDTLLAIYTGNSVNQLAPVASNDDSPYTDNLSHILTSSLSFTATAGTTYRIAVDGSGGRFGNFALRWGADVNISGQVSFLGNSCGFDKKVTMLLSGEDARAVTFTGSGTYTFEHLRAGGNYSVRGVSEISANCLPLFLERAQNAFPLAGNVLDANFVDDGLRGGGSTSNITGHVQNASGVGLYNVAIALSGTASRTVYTDNAGLYLLPNLPAGTYQVTPSKAGVVFTPASLEFTFTTGRTITDADFATQDSFNLSGQTRDQNGASLSGVTIMLNNGTQAVSVQTDGNGYYAFDATAGSSYTLTAAKAGLSFTPATQSISTLNANQKNIDFTGTQTQIQTHTLTVMSANPGSGVNITVSPADKNNLANGATQFTRTYDLNTTINLTATATAGTNVFQKWLKDGVDYSTSLNTSLTLDANHTMTAVYLTTAVQTTAGQNVSVELNGVKVTFASVTGPGTTTITPINPAAAGQLPSGYQLTGDSIAFDISTTAIVQPPISVCFNVPFVTDATVFAQLRLLHNENGTLLDRTSTYDFPNKLICANVNSLSRFVVASSSLPFLQLLLEDSDASSTFVAALDALLLVRDPFTVLNVNNLLNRGTDRNTRVLVFVKNLQLLAGESAAVVTVNLVDSSGRSYSIVAESIWAMPALEFNQLTFRLPDELAPGECTVQIKAHGQVSNAGIIRIK